MSIIPCLVCLNLTTKIKVKFKALTIRRLNVFPEELGSTETSYTTSSSAGSLRYSLLTWELGNLSETGESWVREVMKQEGWGSLVFIIHRKMNQQPPQQQHDTMLDKSGVPVRAIKRRLSQQQSEACSCLDTAWLPNTYPWEAACHCRSLCCSAAVSAHNIKLCLAVSRWWSSLGLLTSLPLTHSSGSQANTKHQTIFFQIFEKHTTLLLTQLFYTNSWMNNFGTLGLTYLISPSNALYISCTFWPCPWFCALCPRSCIIVVVIFMLDSIDILSVWNKRIVIRHKQHRVVAATSKIALKIHIMKKEKKNQLL